jgi:hypothetical protein
MFTLQARLIENAASSTSPSNSLQAVANCAAPLEHRGPVSLTHEPQGQGGNRRPGGEFPGLTYITIPPWANIPFEPMPFLDMPNPVLTPSPWSTVPFGTPVAYERRSPTLTVGGDSRLGDVFADNVYADNLFLTNFRPRALNIVKRVALVDGELVAIRQNMQFLCRQRGPETTEIICS